MDAAIQPHVEFDVATGNHQNLIKNVANTLEQPAEYYYRARNDVNQVVIRLRSPFVHRNGLRLYMQPDNLYITGFSSGQIYEFRGHDEHENSIKLPFNSSYPFIPGASLGRDYFHDAVVLLAHLANLAQPNTHHMQQPIFVIIYHIAEAVRFKSVTNLLLKSQREQVLVPVNALIIRQFNGWKAISQGIQGYTGPVYVTEEERQMVHGEGDWGSNPKALEAMTIIENNPRLCAYLVKVRWKEPVIPVPPPPRQHGRPVRTSRRH